MPVIHQKLISREDLKANPTVLYLFGDNLKRYGLGGQAGAMRGEVNAVGIATKKGPSMRVSSFFTDDEYDANFAVFVADLYRVVKHLQVGGTVIIPLDGLGTGLSELPTRAPLTNLALLEFLHQLEEI